MKPHTTTPLMALITLSLLLCSNIHAATRKDLLETASRYLCCLKGQKPQGADAHPLLKEDSGHSESPAGAGAGAGVVSGHSFETKITSVPNCLKEIEIETPKNYDELYYRHMGPLEPFFESGIDAGAQKKALEEEIEKMEGERDLDHGDNLYRLRLLKKNLEAYWTLRRTSCTSNTEKTDIVAEALHAALLHKKNIEHTLAQKNQEIEALNFRLGLRNAALIKATIDWSERNSSSHAKWLESAGHQSTWLYKDVMVRILQEKITAAMRTTQNTLSETKREDIKLSIQQTQLALDKAIEERDAIPIR
ncbi:MAG: hypothetical protein WCJ17_02050 [bacterium]